MTLHLLVDQDLQIAVKPSSGSSSTLEYEMVGPEARVQMLQDAFTRQRQQSTLASIKSLKSQKSQKIRVPEFRGQLSPKHAITLSSERRKDVGIPPAAVSFSFAYPIAGSGAAKLERFNLATEPWIYFFILGGFVYFDDDDHIVRINSLTLTVVSARYLRFSGPYPAVHASVRALRAQGRLQAVGFDALLQSGHAEFGWVVPDEQFDGRALGVECAYEAGAFVYVEKDSSAVYYVLEHKEAAEEVGASDRVRFSAMLENFSRQRSDSELHAQEQKRQVTWQPRGIGRGSLPPTWLQVLWMLVVPLATVVLVTLGVSGLVYLARFHRIAFEAASTFVWYSLLAVIVGFPVQDTAAVTTTRARRLAFRLVLIALPILCSLLVLTLRFAILGRDVVHAHAVVSHLAMYAVGVALPLFLYALRVRQARMLERHAAMVNMLGNIFVGEGLRAAAKPAAASTADRSVTRRIAKAISARMIWRLAPPATRTPPRAACPEAARPPRVSRLSRLPLLGGGRRRSETGLQVIHVVGSQPQLVQPQLVQPQLVQPQLVGGVELGGVQPSLHAGVQPPPHGHSSTCAGGASDGGSVPVEMESNLPRRAAAQRAALVRARAAKAAAVASSRLHSTSMASPMPMTRPAAVSCAAFPSGLSGVSTAARAGAALRQALHKPREARRRAYAATMVQTVWRRLRAQAAYEAELNNRRRRLLSFSRPIFFASLLNLIGNSVLSHSHAAGLPLHPTWRNLGWLLLLLPCVVVIVRDLAAPSPPRFSITHCIFFVAVLYPTTYSVVEFDAFVYNVLADALKGGFVTTVAGTEFTAEMLAPSLGLIIHIVLMLVLLTLAKQVCPLTAAP